MGNKDLVIIEPSNYAVMQAETNVAELVKENLGEGEQITAFDLDKIPIPSGGGLFFEIETIDGPEAVKEIQGVPVFTKISRSFWIESYDDSGGGSPPDCVSDDGNIGYPTEPVAEKLKGMVEIRPDGGVLCANCPYNKFGSAKVGDGKACQERRFFFIVPPDSSLPLFLSTPPTSLGLAKKYLLRLASHSLPYWSRIMKIYLTKSNNRAGTEYSKVNFQVAAKLSPEEVDFFKKYHDEMLPIFEATAREAARAREEEVQDEPAKKPKHKPAPKAPPKDPKKDVF